MNSAKYLLSSLLAVSTFCSLLNGQKTSSSAQSTIVPRLVNFSGKAVDPQGKSITGIAGATFAIYKDQYEGSPLWLETQNVQADAKGNYAIQLGATKPDGLPLDLFNSGEARWLGVTVNGGTEQPRVLLLSVPYALKAADAETVGGLPASAFVLANKTQSMGTNTKSAATPAASTKNAPPPANPAVTGKGTLDFIPMWDSASDIINSTIFQKSSSIGIGTTAPTATLDVNGKSDVRDTLTLFPKGTDSTLAVNGTTFKVDQTGKVTFVSGQTFPGTGTVTSVALSAPTTDFVVTGSPVTKTGTLKIAWTAAPTNTNVANAIVKRDASGNFSATTITATGQLFAQALSGNGNAITATSASPIATVIYGAADSATGATYAVEGETSSSDPGTAGVVGAALGGGNGVLGLFKGTPSSANAGVYGQMSTASTWGSGILPTGAGVWGDTGLSSNASSNIIYAGVLGTAGDSAAGLFLNNSPTGWPTLRAWNYDSSGSLLDAYNVSNFTYCRIDAGGNLACSGSITAVLPLDGGKRKVAVSGIQSPENWFEDFGSAQLVNGVAVVQIDPDFIQTVNSEKTYRVFAQPNGDCRGLYVTNKSTNSFEVHELGGGTSNISFDYRITAIRRKYETVRFADHTNDSDPSKMLEQMGKAKPASSSDPATVKPTSQPRVGIPVAQLTNK